MEGRRKKIITRINENCSKKQRNQKESKTVIQVEHEKRKNIKFF